MTKGNAKELPMDLAKDALRLLEEEQTVLEMRQGCKSPREFESLHLRQRSAESVRSEAF